MIAGGVLVSVSSIDMSMLISVSLITDSLSSSGGFLSLMRSSTRLFGDKGLGGMYCFGDNGGTVGEQRSITDAFSFGCDRRTGTVGKAVLTFRLTGTSLGGSDDTIDLKRDGGDVGVTGGCVCWCCCCLMNELFV